MGTSNSANTARISATVTAALQQQIRDAATRRGGVSAFIADSAAKEAARVMEAEQVIKPSGEDARFLASLLENPPAPNAALRSAATLAIQ